jgi:glycosyltransferase involved in cell wall biosynthesis
MNKKLEQYPLISIVIPSFNQGKYIEQTIHSIVGQQYPNLEIIVIDGGSTDETLEILEKYKDVFTYCVSEPDNGQAHAINKGFRQANGSILAWLNTDDMYLPCALLKVAQIFQEMQEPGLVYGSCLYFLEGERKAVNCIAPQFSVDRLTYDDYIVQPSTFWSRSLWEKVGELNESYNYVLDWDWFIRATKVCDFIPVQDCLSVYRAHSEHKTGTGGMKRAKEIVEVVENYASPEWVDTYRDVYQQLPRLKSGIYQLKRKRLIKLRYLLFPSLYFKYGKRVDNALLML